MSSPATSMAAPTTDEAVDSHSLLCGLSVLTVIRLKHSVAEFVEVNHGGPYANGKYSGYIIDSGSGRNRVVVGTEPIFDAPVDAEAHMQRILDAVRKWEHTKEDQSKAQPLVSARDRAIWRAAITLAHNMCVQTSNSINDDDGPLHSVKALSTEAKRIRGWLEPSDEQLVEMFTEAGVPG